MDVMNDQTVSSTLTSMIITTLIDIDFRDRKH